MLNYITDRACVRSVINNEDVCMVAETVDSAVNSIIRHNGRIVDVIIASQRCQKLFF